MIRLAWALSTGLLKLTLVSLVAIAASHWITWRGRSLSDRVQSSLSGIERQGTETVRRGWRSTEAALRELKVERPRPAAPSENAEAPSVTKGPREKIAGSDRARLDALMRDAGSDRN